MCNSFDEKFYSSSMVTEPGIVQNTSQQKKFKIPNEHHCISSHSKSTIGLEGVN